MTAHGSSARISSNGSQVELAQRPLVDARVEREALGLGVVGDEVLDRRGDALGLQPAHVRGADPRRQQRVLAEALEVAPAERRAVEVDASARAARRRPCGGTRTPAAARAARSAPRPRSRPARSATARWPTARARPSARRGRPRARPTSRSAAARRPARRCSDQKSAPVSRRTFCSSSAALQHVLHDASVCGCDARADLRRLRHLRGLADEHPPRRPSSSACRRRSPTPGAPSTSRSWRRSATARGRG